MPNINKVTSGNVYSDNFSTLNLLWDIHSDPSRVSLTADGAVLSHGDNIITMTMPAPMSDYVFQAEISHNPVILSDIGGIIVQSVTNENIECQTYYDYYNNAISYKYIKVVCYQETYTFYVSIDGKKWDLIGNSKLPNANRIGFMLQGSKQPNSSDFIAKHLEVYKSTVVTFITSETFTGCHSVVITDQMGDKLYEANSAAVIKNEFGKVYINMVDALMPLNNVNIVLSDKEGNAILSQDRVDICGGDVFDIHSNYAIYVQQDLINEVELNTNKLFDFGQLRETENIFYMRIENKDSETMNGKLLKIEPYSTEYRGADLVQIAVLNNDKTYGVFGNYIDLPDIMGMDSFNFVVKITKDIIDTGVFYADSYKFKLTLV